MLRPGKSCSSNDSTGYLEKYKHREVKVSGLVGSKGAPDTGTRNAC